MAFEHLFSPLQIGEREFKNRYWASPLNFIFNDWTGLVNDTELFFWLARAMGGVSVIDFGALLTTELGKKMAPHPWVYMTSHEEVPGLSFFTESMRLAGAKSIAQILPSASARSHTCSGLQGVAPSGGIVYPWVTIPSKEMNDVIKNSLMGVEYSREGRRYKAPREISREEIREPLEDHVKHMIQKLEANTHKGGWKHMSTRTLFGLLVDEVLELQEAIFEGNIDHIKSEASDVSNFSFMIADTERLKNVFSSEVKS